MRNERSLGKLTKGFSVVSTNWHLYKEEPSQGWKRYGKVKRQQDNFSASKLGVRKTNLKILLVKCNGKKKFVQNYCSTLRAS